MSKKYRISIFIIFFLMGLMLYKAKITHSNLGLYFLIPMDEGQSNHLKAYGLTYQALAMGLKGEWLLNYKSGSFLLPFNETLKEKAALMNVFYQVISEEDKEQIYKTIEKNNMKRIEIRKAPKIAVYTPPNKEPWDDAVTLVLTYAEIPYDKLWDSEVLKGKLSEYDWLHLHHEDFTGQFGKFYAIYKKADWYLKKVIVAKEIAKKAGFSSVQEFKAHIASEIQKYVKNGGFLFAMCSATDTIDIALSAKGIDIIAEEIDGTPFDENYKSKLKYNQTFAFKNYFLFTNPNVYEYSTIDVNIEREGLRIPDTFELFEFSAKIDPIPTMLNQNHKQVIKGFLGQTTAYYKNTIKSNITILGETPGTQRVKYIHGNSGKGTFTFYGGHDPEDYQHFIGDPPTNLALHPNSPGYRLILNNILFPSAKKEKQKT